MEFNPMHILINRGADEYIDVCLKYSLLVDLQFFKVKREMLSYFERSMVAEFRAGFSVFRAIFIFCCV